nr:hypothetical protein BaRGS_015151 [Batillaria attramentaria]
MSAAGDTSNPPLSVTGLASASADARLVFVFVPMTQIASSFEPAYSLVDLTSSESLEELIPVLEEAPPREQTETGTQTVKTLTHGTTQTCKELLPPEIVYAETGVGSHFAILPPEPEMGVGSEDALWEAPHIVTADASVGSQHVFPPTPARHDGSRREDDFRCFCDVGIQPLHPAIHTTSTDIAHRVPFCIDSITSEIGRRVIPKA